MVFPDLSPSPPLPPPMPKESHTFIITSVCSNHNLRKLGGNLCSQQSSLLTILGLEIAKERVIIHFSILDAGIREQYRHN